MLCVFHVCVSEKKYLEMEPSKMRAKHSGQEHIDENDMKDNRIARMILAVAVRSD